MKPIGKYANLTVKKSYEITDNYTGDGKDFITIEDDAGNRQEFCMRGGDDLDFFDYFVVEGDLTNWRRV